MVFAESDLDAAPVDVADFEAAEADGRGAGDVGRDDGLPVSMDERTELRN